jgi:hypothetical protein
MRELGQAKKARFIEDQMRQDREVLVESPTEQSGGFRALATTTCG